MVGAIWIDSGSDSETGTGSGHHRRHRRSQDSRAIPGPSRLDESPLRRRSPRRAAAASPSSPAAPVILSSSQDQDLRTAAGNPRSHEAATEVLDRPLADKLQPTPGQRMAQLLADASPDTSLPSFRDLLRQHKLRTTATASAASLRPGDIVVAGVSATRMTPGFSRASSLRRIASQPAASSSQELPTSSHFRASVRRATSKIPAPAEIIEIGSDSIFDEVDAPLVLQTSSPIRSQFSARHPPTSSQPLPLSTPPRPRAFPVRRDVTSHGPRQLLRADSAPIVILSSSPPPSSLPMASQRSLGQIVEDIAQEGNESPDLPPSSFPFDDPPPSPPFSPIGGPLEAVDMSPSFKRRAAEASPRPLNPKRAKPMQRNASLLEALDSLYGADATTVSDISHTKAIDGDIHRDAAAANQNRQNGINVPRVSPSPSPSPSKRSKAAAAKESREAKAREREAVKAAKLRAAADKKRFLEVNRLRTSKSETMRELIVDLDRALFSAGQPFAGCQESITARFEEEGASVNLCDSVVAPPLIRFRRKVKAEWNVDRRHWVPLDREAVRREGMVIVYIDAKEIVQLMKEGEEEGLDSWYVDLMRRLRVMDGGKEDEQVFLICQGLVRYYSRLKANENRAYTARIRQQLAETDEAATLSEGVPKPRRKATGADAATTTSVPPQSSVERGLLQLKLIRRCFVIHAASLVDGIEWLHQLSSDLSLKPYKSLRDTHLSFAVDTGRNTSSSSSSTIYSMMLQQIPRVTPAIANSITTIYPSLNALITAYERCSNEHEEKALLTGVQVQSNKDGTERSGNRTNLGLQLSKRIHAVVRGRNGELLVSNPTKD